MIRQTRWTLVIRSCTVLVWLQPLACTCTSPSSTSASGFGPYTTSYQCGLLSSASDDLRSVLSTLGSRPSCSLDFEVASLDSEDSSSSSMDCKVVVGMGKLPKMVDLTSGGGALIPRPWSPAFTISSSLWNMQRTQWCSCFHLEVSRWSSLYLVNWTCIASANVLLLLPELWVCASMRIRNNIISWRKWEFTNKQIISKGGSKLSWYGCHVLLNGWLMVQWANNPCGTTQWALGTSGEWQNSNPLWQTSRLLQGTRISCPWWSTRCESIQIFW